jgi:hypothetical protein
VLVSDQSIGVSDSFVLDHKVAISRCLHFDTIDCNLG